MGILKDALQRGVDELRKAKVAMAEKKGKHLSETIVRNRQEIVLDLESEIENEYLKLSAGSSTEEVVAFVEARYKDEWELEVANLKLANAKKTHKKLFDTTSK